MAEGAADRTEKATPKRREDARKHGQVVLSPEVAPVAVLLTALTVASWGAPVLLARSRDVLTAWLAAIGPVAAHDDPTGPLVLRAVGDLGALLVPFILCLAVVGIGVVVAQVGWSVNPELVLPDPARLGFSAGAKRIFSVSGLMNLLKAVVKIVLVVVVAQGVGRRVGAAAIAAPGMAVDGILGLAADGLRQLFLVMALPLGLLGAADWVWQRWRYEQSLKMSRHELREEHKESEGDPHVKSRVRRVGRELRKRRMLADVARADVVLANPIHVAVALRYRPDMRAPQVVAKGAGDLAQKIKAAARAAGVPIVERRALARALFRSVQLGAEVPPALYRAVAEILAYIYSLRATAAPTAEQP